MKNCRDVSKKILISCSKRIHSRPNCRDCNYAWTKFIDLQTCDIWVEKPGIVEWSALFDLDKFNPALNALGCTLSPPKKINRNDSMSGHTDGAVPMCGEMSD